MSQPILQADSVTKSFKLGKVEIPVLKGVDISLQAGEMLALLGTSGAGKSTLLHVLGLLDPPSSGRILYEGEEVQSLPAPKRASLRHQKIGFVFQFYHLIPELTALQNVKLGSMMDVSLGTWWKRRKELDARSRELLQLVGLEKRLRHRPAELSGGERQRVAIARALIANPKVILADEPTGNLDSHTADEVLELLFHINQERGISFLLVTHNEELAARCHRIVRLKDGVVIGEELPVTPGAEQEG
ncbi:MAG: ABC transporter ATP-binding protein [Planctomycetota bacterium]|jgi:ABC-type lipoprotein export system ATPase subunit